MKNQPSNSLNLFEQYKAAIQRESELRNRLRNAKSREEAGELFIASLVAINKTFDLREALVECNAAFMDANDNFAGNSVFPSAL